MAAVVGETGLDALKSLAVIMLGFYATCLAGEVAQQAEQPHPGRQLEQRAEHDDYEPDDTTRRPRPRVRSTSASARPYLLLIASTSSSETALPRLIAKMEHLGVSRPVVGITVPTGYSFNLDGTAIYLTMASIFIAEALNDPLSVGEQISLLVFVIIASKGAAGVTVRAWPPWPAGCSPTARTLWTASG